MTLELETPKDIHNDAIEAAAKVADKEVFYCTNCPAKNEVSERAQRIAKGIRELKKEE